MLYRDHKLVATARGILVYDLSDSKQYLAGPFADTASAQRWIDGHIRRTRNAKEAGE